MDNRIAVVQGAITRQHVDAIVNAANESLLGGGGVDGTIHRAAGPELLAECRAIGSCRTGEAVITRGSQLPATRVMQAVGPVWIDGCHGEPELLGSCYRNSMKLASENGISTIAFPSISAGAHGYPVHQAAQIAIRTIAECLRADSAVREVRFVCFDERTYAAYHWS